jgi:hypothetical protein
MTKKELRRIKNDAFLLLKNKSNSAAELEYHLENIARAMSSDFDWASPDVVRKVGKNQPFITDWTKPLSVIRIFHHSEIPFQMFFNKDLELLKNGAQGTTKYATSITFTPAAHYTQSAIEEAAINRHLFVKKLVKYDRDAELGIHHWYSKRQSWYKYKLALQKSKEPVYSDLRIMAVINVSGSRRCDYIFLEEITVRRIDNNLYKFSEADFPDLNLNDIEDMYLMKVQGKLQHLTNELRYALSTSLCHYIRRTIIKERVEDLQLGVESYQTQLNLVEPQFLLNSNKDPQYTMLHRPNFGFVYRSTTDFHRFMAFNEIHKFCDDTLKSVRDGLANRVRDSALGKSKRWNSKELRQVKEFIQKMEERLYHRDQMRRLESYVGGRPPFAIRLFQRTDPVFTTFGKGG